MIETVFEDKDILIVNKPSGISSQEDLTEGEDVTTHFSGSHCITRLDKRVSGLMVLAKNATAAASLSDLLKKGEIEKIYQCVVAQKPELSEGRLTHWIKKEAKAKVFTKDTAGAQKAILDYKVIKSSERYHLLEIKLQTGRFHQIRAQLSAIGSPILGDLKYGFKRSSPDGSIFLCCTKIKIGDISAEIKVPNIWEKYGLG